MPYAVDSNIGPFRLLEFLGRGAFGEVWLAEKASSIARTRMAIKLPISSGIDLDAMRLEAELWISAANHPNVLPIFEADIFDDQIVIASQYAPDGSLKDWLIKHGGKAPSLVDAITIAIGILSGLEHLHVHKIIHRDLKPANILMQDNCPRIADFGLARRFDSGQTKTGAAGTPLYMAPEVFDGERTVATDIWATGVLLYEMLEGRHPFIGRSLENLIRNILHQSPLEMSRSNIPGMQAIVYKALEKEKASRYRSAADMRAALQDLLGKMPLGENSDGIGSLRGCRTIAITGSSDADAVRTKNRLASIVAPYCSANTTWYCGTVGVVDEEAANFLLSNAQRLVAIGYGKSDISIKMQEIISRYGAPFVNAQDEEVPQVSGAPSKRDVFFSRKAELVIILWNGRSSGSNELLSWLRRQGKDHIVVYI